VVVQPPPPVVVPPPPPQVRPIDAPAFDQLFNGIRRAALTQDRMMLLTQYAPRYRFLVNQVASLLSLFSFDDARLQALEKLAPLLVDPQNGHQLVEMFAVPPAKERARQILHVVPRR
jgi:hypothetical protein